jgi:uncharacterized repeat protein (TIGR03803 family)
MSNRFFARMLLAVCGVFAFPFHATAQVYTDLHDFNASVGDPQGLTQEGPIRQGRDGNLYGTTHAGGSSSAGTFFNMKTSGTPSVLGSFTSTTGDLPFGGTTFGTDGNFYGATSSGGTFGYGTLFRVNSKGVITKLYDFSNTGDGAAPTTPPVGGPSFGQFFVTGGNGDFYGVTTGLVNGTQYPSTFYKIYAPGFLLWHVFANSEGSQCSGVVLGSNGNFWGGCNYGGANNQGTLFQITPNGTLTVMHNFVGSDGLFPGGLPMVQAADGNYYGVTAGGGSFGFGTVFQLQPTGVHKVLYHFTGGADGATPAAGLTVGADGNLYGTTAAGGSFTSCANGCGVIFKITTSGTYSVQYTFDGSHGSNPQSALALDTDGHFYGTTSAGGANGGGVFYSFDVGFSAFASLVTAQGTVGSTAGILGQGFSTSSVVKFGGVQATKFSLTGSTYISVVVPTGALTGSVTVETGATTLTSLQTFKVTPTITAFNPTTGPVGTIVTITGTGLTQTTQVAFKGTSATFTVNSDSQITATVPTGAATGRIKVTTNGGTATTASNFTVTH